MSDPVTSPVPAAVSDDRTMPAVTYALFLLGFASGWLTTLIGLVIAYSNRGAATPAMATHYTFLIRTFWLTFGWALIGLVLVVIGALLSIVLIGIPILKLGLLIWALIAVWFAIRCIVGAVHLARNEAYPRPRAWLI